MLFHMLKYNFILLLLGTPLLTMPLWAQEIVGVMEGSTALVRSEDTALIFTSYNASTQAHPPYILTDIFPSAFQIDEEKKQFFSFVDKKLEHFVDASAAQHYDEAYDAWFSVCCRFFSLKLLCEQITTLSQDAALKAAAERAFLHMQSYFSNRLKEERIIHTFQANGIAADILTPLQRDITEKILLTSVTANDLSLQTLNGYRKHNYTTKQFPQKEELQTDTLRAFTANILCFPDNLSYLYGGVSPWPNRIEQIVAKILATHAHVVALQEVWDPKVMTALVERLKTEYSYFVCDAGNQFATLDPEEIGFSSGLFVASRLPLKNISFTPFARCIPAKAGARRGAIKAEVTLNGKIWTFVATHMQHGSEIGLEIRKEQLELCTELLRTGERGFLMGDLNINAFSNEFKIGALSVLYSIPYLHGQSTVTKANATQTDYFNDLVHIPLSERSNTSPVFELLDYCVALKEFPDNEPVKQDKVFLFSIEEPCEALSDHHGLLTLWK
jgi:endonuclease/exonuclease/phosphatase family metal-dependent hydrolase